jgi:quercetin dioxygenase-like cupin family protein
MIVIDAPTDAPLETEAPHHCAARLTQLLAELHLGNARLNEDDLARVVTTIGTRPHLFADLVGHSETARWWMLLLRAANFEVRLLSWEHDQSSDWHDHGGSSGAFYVAQGALREQYRDADGVATRSRRLDAGRSGSFGPSHVHDVVHAAGRPAVSVHAYSPPLTGLTYYERTPHGFVARAVVPEPAFSRTGS